MKGYVLHRASARDFALISMHLLFLILINIIQYAQNYFSRNILKIAIRAMCQKHDDLNKQILHCRFELCKICPAILVQSIRTKIQEVDSILFNHLYQIKAQKLEQLKGPPIAFNTVVTLPENLPLSDAERPVLRKGLDFVPIYPKNWTNSQLRKVLKNFFTALN